VLDATPMTAFVCPHLTTICRLESMARNTVTRELAHEPLGCRPKVLEVTIRRTGASTAGTCGDTPGVATSTSPSSSTSSRVALLAGKALDECRRRGHQAIRGHRGRTGL